MWSESLDGDVEITVSRTSGPLQHGFFFSVLPQRGSLGAKNELCGPWVKCWPASESTCYTDEQKMDEAGVQKLVYSASALRRWTYEQENGGKKGQ